jgi:arylsulfatase A-like enzyme
VVVYSTDHGDMMGEHRLIAKGVQYEGASRVPLIVRVPGPVRTGDGQRHELAPRRIATPVSQVDLLPTLLAALNVEAPAHLQGRSLLPLMAGGDTPATLEDAEVVFEWSGARDGVAADGHRVEGNGAAARAAAAEQRTIRRGHWKLTVDEAGEHELYDLSTDLHETRNLLYGDRLAGSAGAAAAVTDLWERLRAWQARTADTVDLPAPAPWGA